MFFTYAILYFVDLKNKLFEMRSKLKYLKT